MGSEHGARPKQVWPRWIGGAAAVLLLAGSLATWRGLRTEPPPPLPPIEDAAAIPEDALPPLAAPAEAAEAPAEEEQPLIPLEELPDYGPDSSLAGPPEAVKRPAIRVPAPAPEDPPEPVDEAAMERARLEAHWNELHRRFRVLVDSHGEDRVGSIALLMKQAVETSLARFIDDSAEYGTLSTQLQALDRIVREREDALR